MILTDRLRREARNIVVYGLPGGGTTPLVSGLSTSDVDVKVVEKNNVRIIVKHQFVPAVVDTLPGFGYGADTPLNLTLTASATQRLL